MNNVRAELLKKIWHGQDPFASFPAGLYQADTQGWKGTHTYLTEGIEAIRPRVIVEIGVWKGQSVLTMAGKLKEKGIEGVILAIDTWLGAWDHWVQKKWFDHLCIESGLPQLAKKFYANVTAASLEEFVIPLPLDSSNANYILSSYKIAIDMLHLDAAHDYKAVRNDLELWWPLIRPGGLLIGDDYAHDGTWPGVRKAFDEFFGDRNLLPIEHWGGKCRLVKPAAA